MGLEEQKEEREVLDSIFPDEITDISDTAYRISITLDTADTNRDSCADANNDPPILLLNVSYPDSYPDTGPNLDITSPPNATKYPYLDLSNDKAQLLEALDPTIEESLGMAMVFTLVTTLKEVAETLIADRQRQQQEIQAVEAAKKEEEANRKFHGTSVTRERFIEWRENFRKEMAEKAKVEKEEADAEEKKKRGGGAAGGLGKVGGGDEKKMTGRMLWEKGLAQRVDEDGIDGDGSGAAVTDGVEKLKIEA